MSRNRLDRRPSPSVEMQGSRMRTEGSDPREESRSLLGKAGGTRVLSELSASLLRHPIIENYHHRP